MPRVGDQLRRCSRIYEAGRKLAAGYRNQREETANQDVENVGAALEPAAARIPAGGLGRVPQSSKKRLPRYGGFTRVGCAHVAAGGPSERSPLEARHSMWTVLR